MSGVPSALLADSSISLLVLDNNPITPSQLQAIPGYQAYSDRYTQTKKKGD